MSKKWEEVSDILTPKGIEELKANVVLKFNQPDGSVREFIVRRKTKDGKVYVEEVELLDPDEVKLKGNVPGKHFEHIIDFKEELGKVWCETCNEAIEEEEEEDESILHKK